MARSHALLMTSIWRDTDFLALSAVSQRHYMMLISQPDLNGCGLLAYRPKRWAALAHDTTPASIARQIAPLIDRQMILLDEDAEELLIRTHMRHDRVLSNPNMFKSACRAFGAVSSPLLRLAVVKGLPEPLREGFPEGFLELHPKALGEVLREALDYGFPEGLLDLSPHPPPSTLLVDNPSGDGTEATTQAVDNIRQIREAMPR